MQRFTHVAAEIFLVCVLSDCIIFKIMLTGTCLCYPHETY